MSMRTRCPRSGADPGSSSTTISPRSRGNTVMSSWTGREGSSRTASTGRRTKTRPRALEAARPAHNGGHLRIAGDVSPATSALTVSDSPRPSSAHRGHGCSLPWRGKPTCDRPTEFRIGLGNQPQRLAVERRPRLLAQPRSASAPPQRSSRPHESVAGVAPVSGRADRDLTELTADLLEEQRGSRCRSRRRARGGGRTRHRGRGRG